MKTTCVALVGDITYQVLESMEQLTKHFSGLVFGQLLVGDYAVEQFAFRRKLQHKIDGITFVKSIFQTKNIGMTDAHEHSDLLL